jgi:nucleotide-binding universal stress UspA family protein
VVAAMISVNRILCPVDLSEASAAALHVALWLARWYGARVTVPHIVSFGIPPAPFGMVSVLTLTPEQRDEEEGRLRAFIAAAEPGGVEVAGELREGRPISEVLRIAGDEAAVLIVMGTHGRTGFEHLLMGSTTERVLRKAECPVLTLRAGTRPDPVGSSRSAPFRRILCAVDFSPASLEGVKYALSLAGESGGRLTLLHVVEWIVDLSVAGVAGAEAAMYQGQHRDAAVKRLADVVPNDARTWCEIEETVAIGRSYETILDTALKTEADLIVIGTQGRKRFMKHVLGATADHVVRAAECPVLTVPGGEPAEAPSPGA